MHPTIDHGFLSPSGKMSKRAREQYLKRLGSELFPKELFPHGLKGEQKQPTEKENLLAHAKRLRDLANSGMNTRKYNKLAMEAEEKANKLED